MLYESLEGFFNWQFLYDEMISIAKDGEFIIEIGTWEGRSVTYLAEKIRDSGKNIKVLAIDPYIYGLVGNQEDANEFHRLEKLRKTLQENDLSDIVASIVQTSDDAAEWIKKSKIKVAGVFIDGNHAKDYCLRDIQNYGRLVKEGGIIAGHDYTPDEWQGVVDAVNEEIGEGNFEIVNNIWIKRLY